jgi:hypothetical protein
LSSGCPPTAGFFGSNGIATASAGIALGAPEALLIPGSPVIADGGISA